MARLRVLGENPPPPRGTSEEQLRELRDYLTRLKDELEFLMTHLGEDNFAESLATWVTDTGKSVESINASIDNINGEIGDINTALAGKQDTLTFDDTPTSGSENPVKSGGIYDGLQRKSNPNILRNWFFVGGATARGVLPVNQRGQSSYGVSGYTIDGWKCSRAEMTLAIDTDYVRWQRASASSFNPTFTQAFAPLPDGTYTLSMLCRGTFRYFRMSGGGSVAYKTLSGDWDLLQMTFTSTGGNVTSAGWQDSSAANGYDDTGKYVDVKAIKLEPGSEQTLGHKENEVWVLNDMPDYEMELLRCQTCHADANDSYANLSVVVQ